LGTIYGASEHGQLQTTVMHLRETYDALDIINYRLSASYNPNGEENHSAFQINAGFMTRPGLKNYTGEIVWAFLC
jgi:hypothetical protein